MERPKGVSLIIARPKGKTTTATQAIRYDKDEWTEEQARADCEDKGGTFEAATKESLQQYPEASWKDIISLEGVFMDNKIDEAVTIKAQIQSILKQADALLGTKDLPDSVKAPVKDMRQALKKSWDELSKDGDGEEGKAAEEALGEATKTEDGEDMPPIIRKAVIEDMDIDGDFMALVEGVKGDTVRVKIIQPGWGSSGYYPSEVLERDAGIYGIGTKMFWDHPTRAEETERPERSLRDMAGVLISDGKWDAGGSAGADATRYLRGDQTWQVPPGGGGTAPIWTRYL